MARHRLIASGALLAAAVLVLVLWILWGTGAIQCRLGFPVMAGSFDGIDALFSGLALAALAVGLFLQSRELELQREELAATREELRLQREALQAQARESHAQVEALQSQAMDIRRQGEVQQRQLDSAVLTAYLSDRSRERDRAEQPSSVGGSRIYGSMEVTERERAAARRLRHLVDEAIERVAAPVSEREELEERVLALVLRARVDARCDLRLWMQDGAVVAKLPQSTDAGERAHAEPFIAALETDVRREVGAFELKTGHRIRDLRFYNDERGEPTVRADDGWLE